MEFEKIKFRFCKAGFNDSGKYYYGMVIERLANGYKVQIGESVVNVVMEDIDDVKIWKARK